MAKIIERQIPFTAEMADGVHRTREQDGRAFNQQAAALIREALAARATVVAITGTINENEKPNG